MARLTREQSQALTREKLLASASEVVARDGYSGATIERIAEEAGFSKGAFYSNFANKEDIFLQLLERNAGGDVIELTERLHGMDDPRVIIDSMSDWANQRAKDKRWGTLAIDLLRIARRDNTLEDRHLKLFRDQWEGLGRLLSGKLFPYDGSDLSPLHVGGIVLELVYGGMASFMSEKAPGEMVRAALTSMHEAHLYRHASPEIREARAAAS
ncbi:TetR family transcriptional regulator [Mesorhizobium sp. L-8-10]|uniref:TetR/AcrR family transcriptional regulator n=1 Tax=unclassified Mesorhizobium TaxID=325217 RepID=UPI0019277D4B|nr:MULTISPECIES: TetR/AcrR family transcriptional regulator [unclassified Mesorhizobium]BCH27774.1 TetR family transcriptional regulator [Mesorhizobium sp. L-8-3]BCH35723.1 TetR family transcriptional regulator [Mesorhizobium sp. L-8-10]